MIPVKRNSRATIIVVSNHVEGLIIGRVNAATLKRQKNRQRVNLIRDLHAVCLWAFSGAVQSLGLHDEAQCLRCECMRVFVVGDRQDTDEASCGVDKCVGAHNPLGIHFLELVELDELVSYRGVVVISGLEIFQDYEQTLDLDLEVCRLLLERLDVDQSSSFRRGLIIGRVNPATLEADC